MLKLSNCWLCIFKISELHHEKCTRIAPSMLKLIFITEITTASRRKNSSEKIYAQLFSEQF